MLLFPEEDLEGHTFFLEVTDPSGNRTKLSESQRLSTRRSKTDPSLPSGSALIVKMTIAIATAGRLLLHLMVDNVEMKTFTVTIQGPDEQRAEGPFDG
jgi:hypothetical protein